MRMPPPSIKNASTVLLIAALIFTSFNSLRSEDYNPFGIITFHFKPLNDEASECFVPLLVRNKYLICTTAVLMTSTSQVGMVSDGREHWASVLDLVEGCREKSDDVEKFVSQNIEGPLCFLPLVEKEPVEEAAKDVWSIIRNRAIELDASLNDVPTSEVVLLRSYGLGGDPKIVAKSLELKITSREKLYNTHQWRTGLQLYYFKLDGGLEVSDLGAPLFRDKTSRKEEVPQKFLGVCATNIDYHDDSDYKVLLDPITILRLYEQHLHLPVSKAKKRQSSPANAPNADETHVEKNDNAQNPPSS